jgi:EAL domain-containing protein (putative c-di-GMP-specific phosphodiesterase class I)
VARIERNAFVILAERLSALADATRLADRILGDLGGKIEVSGRAFFIGASIGIALAGRDSQSAEAVLRDAETARLRARDRRGPGSYEVFDDPMRERATLRLELGNDLRWALERGELFLEYQPIVSVASGRIQGAEALLRWQHPQRGLLPASTLIPLAEETGMILPIGEWALGAACRQSREWGAAGLEEVFVAVNLSATQFRQRELPAVVRGVLREVGLEPRRLELELTETVLVDDVELAVGALGALGETGVGLCIDDFGVGHSSLSYLRRFPMNTLKIDRSFVEDLGAASSADSMLASIIGLAHNLGLKAIAEGVEIERQLQTLRDQACDEFQGHLFSRSLAHDDFAQLALAQPPGPAGAA